jgi:hypothetical protein
MTVIGMEREPFTTEKEVELSVLNFDDYLGSAKGKEFLEEFCLAGYNSV